MKEEKEENSEVNWLELIRSFIAITLLFTLLLTYTGFLDSIAKLIGLIIIVFLIVLILFLNNYLSDLREIAEILLIFILLSKIFIGPRMLVPLVAVTSQSMLHQKNNPNEWKNRLISHDIPKEKIEKFPMQNGFDRGDMIVVKTPDGKGEFNLILPFGEKKKREIFKFTWPTFFSKTKLGDVIIYERDFAHGGGEPIIHRVVGIVHIKNWSVEKIEGTLDCLTIDEINSKYIPMIVNCINTKGNCPYKSYPSTGDFNFYITKGDNNKRTDQCGSIAYPINDKQLLARGWIRLPYIGWLKLIMNSFLRI